MDAAECMELLNEIENDFPVDKWKINNIHVWPYIRVYIAYNIYYKIYGENQGLIQSEDEKEGFYKKIKGEDGKSKILTLDLDTLEYRDKKKAKFPTLELTKSIDDLKERTKVLVAGKDKAGEFYGWFHSHPIGLSLSHTDTGSQLRMQELYGDYVGAVISYGANQIRFFIMQDNGDTTIPHFDFQDKNDLLVGVLKESDETYRGMIKKIDSFSQAVPLPVNKGSKDEHISMVDLKKDLADLKETSIQLSDRIATYHQEVQKTNRRVDSIYAIVDQYHRSLLRRIIGWRS